MVESVEDVISERHEFLHIIFTLIKIQTCLDVFGILNGQYFIRFLFIFDENTLLDMGP